MFAGDIYMTDIKYNAKQAEELVFPYLFGGVGYWF